MTRALFSLLLLAGCPDPQGDDDDDDDVDPPARVAAADLEALTTTLASDAFEGRDEGTSGGNDARALLQERLATCGIAPAGVSGFEQQITGGQGTNLLGRIEGTSSPERLIILSAHFDHVGAADCPGICNGAYDNAAGVSAVVGLACEIVKAPLEKTVLVALWDAEEPPTFLTDAMGSEHFAASGLVDLASIDAVLVLDLVGGQLWPGYTKHFVMGAEKSPALSSILDGVRVPDGLPVMRGGLHLVETTPFGTQPWSDYDAFRNRDVPIAFFSDGQNKRYHTAEDEADTLDYDKLTKETEHLFRVVEAIAASTATIEYDPIAQELGRDGETVLAILEDALAPGGLVEVLGLSETSRGKLETTRDAIEGGDVGAATLESGALRVMCYAGTSFDEAGCNFF